MVPSSTQPKPFNMDSLQQEVLQHIFKPGRYLGLEQGAFRKPFEEAKARMLLGFPDLYEIGASSYAIKLLYSVVNRHPDYLCDRVYAPAEDMRSRLKDLGWPIFGVESKRPVTDFDVMAVSLQYELNYTSVLGLIDAAQLPLRSAKREEHHPVVLGGGPGAVNPNPLLPFLDGFLIGDGEELLLEVMEVMANARKQGWTKRQKLEALAGLDGVFVPGISDYARKRVYDISQSTIDIAPLIPAVEAVHDRVVVEARRGCDRMCRFCQPAFINLPARENDVEKIKREALKQLEETGYEECSLLSLSIADYSQFKHLVTDVSSTLKDNKASLSLSSQRADRFSLDVAEAVQTVRKSTLTFAPEAGTPRLRDVINKNLTDADIMNAVTSAYKAGWNKVKLYYMIGLPTETEADLDGIVNTIHKLKTACESIHRDTKKSVKRHLEVNVTLSNFVPKPHTPFQWHAQDTREQLNEKIAYLRGRFKKLKGVKANFTSPDISKLEAVISKGGPELADALELAYRNGAYLDAWDETRPFAKWFEAMESLGIDVEAYTRDRLIHPDDELPWDCIDVGLDKTWLRNEWERSIRAASTTPCFEACSLCGVCSEFSIWPVFAKTEAKPATEEAAEASPQLALPKTENDYGDGADDYVKTPQTATVNDPEAAEKPAFTPITTAINPSAPPSHRVRFTLTKKDSMKYISHLDWLRLLQRVFKKNELPIAYTQGFNPRPKMTFSPALPLFSESECEYVEAFLTQELTDLAAWQERLNNDLPDGATIYQTETIPLLAPSLEKQLVAMDYTVQWTCKDAATPSMIRDKVKGLSALSTLPVQVETKRGERTYDLRPHLTNFQLGPHHQFSFQVRRNSAEGSGPPWVKPQWLLDWIDPEPHWAVRRTALHCQATVPAESLQERSAPGLEPGAEAALLEA